MDRYGLRVGIGLKEEVGNFANRLWVMNYCWFCFIKCISLIFVSEKCLTHLSSTLNHIKYIPLSTLGGIWLSCERK